jgi:hypothetical protein
MGGREKLTFTWPSTAICFSDNTSELFSLPLPLPRPLAFFGVEIRRFLPLPSLHVKVYVHTKTVTYGKTKQWRT